MISPPSARTVSQRATRAGAKTPNSNNTRRSGVRGGMGTATIGIQQLHVTANVSKKDLNRERGDCAAPEERPRVYLVSRTQTF